jgi:flagellar hook-associated protein 2
MQTEEDSNYVGLSFSDSVSVSSVNLSNIVTATQSVAKTAGTASQQIELNLDTSSGPIDLTGKTIGMTIAGVTKIITFSKDLQQLADSAFGQDRVSVSFSGDKIVINSDGTAVSLSSGEVNDAFETVGFTLINAATSRIDTTKSVAENKFAVPVTGDSFEFTINGKLFSFSKDDTIAFIMNSVNKSDAGVKMSYSTITDKFTLTSVKTGSEGSISISDQTGNFMTSAIGSLTQENYSQGRDASVYIDGIKVTRSSNNFTIDGITYNLKADTQKSIAVGIKNDISSAVENIKNFVSDYNELLGAINTKLNEERDNDYLPLTDAQKEKMSESEISKWQEKARSGMLRNDMTLEGIASSLREIMYTPVMKLDDNTTGIGITLADIGITTESYRSQGKLAINEEKLTRALTERSEEIVELFTQKSDKTYFSANTAELKKERYIESGVMQRIADIMENSVGTLYGTGSLLKIAGYSGTSSEAENMITKSLKRYDEKLQRLLDSFELEENRYYKQFTAMETYISQMNQQSAWLAGSFD